MVPLNYYSLDSERENEFLILFQQVYISDDYLVAFPLQTQDRVSYFLLKIINVEKVFVSPQALVRVFV